MKKKLLKTDKILTPTRKVIDTPSRPIILFGYITEPPGGGGGGWDPDYPTYPGTGGGGGESTSDGAGGTLPSGNLCADDQYQVSTTFWAVSIVSFVRFTAYAGAAFSPYIIVQTRSLGGYKTQTGFVTLSSYRTFDVGLYASNTQVHIYFQTSDTNGQCVHWQAMHS